MLKMIIRMDDNKINAEQKYINRASRCMLLVLFSLLC